MKSNDIGSIVSPSSNDVLFGKGHNIHNHSGNKHYRQIVDGKKQLYAMATKTIDKKTISHQVLQTIKGLNPPGRFLKKSNDGKYYEQDDDTVVTKIKQALRENVSARRDRIQANAAAAAVSNGRLTKKGTDASSMSKSRSGTSRTNHRANVPTQKDMNHVLNLLMREEKKE